MKTGLFDSHCHLDCEPLNTDWKNVGERAAEAGVSGFLVPGIEGPVDALPDWVNLYRAWGIHPGVTDRFSDVDFERLWPERPYRPVAIGECGLDTMTDIPLDRQESVFVQQLIAARSEGIPVMIHLRGAWELALRLLKTHAPAVPWIMHNFCGSMEIARLFLKAGAYLSFSGSMCRSNARKTPGVARQVPLNRFLLETDSPDLPPPGWPHSVNEPAAMPLIARRFAEIRGISPSETAERLQENVLSAFGI